MIKSIDFVHYRKIQNIKLDFKPGINAISGENGTCKSSILHIIGNSYQKIKQTNPAVDTKLLNVIKNINQTVNPKIESLTKGDKEYNDPAKGLKGKLFTVEYDDYVCDFRRHAQQTESRYRLILKYPTGEKQSLEEKISGMSFKLLTSSPCSPMLKMSPFPFFLTTWSETKRLTLLRSVSPNLGSKIKSMPIPSNFQEDNNSESLSLEQSSTTPDSLFVMSPQALSTMKMDLLS